MLVIDEAYGLDPNGAASVQPSTLTLALARTLTQALALAPALALSP